MSAWEDFHFLVERDCERRESVVRISNSYSQRVNVARSNGHAIQVGVAKGAIPSKRAIVQAGLCRSREHLHSQVDVTNGVNSSGQVRRLNVVN